MSTLDDLAREYVNDSVDALPGLIRAKISREHRDRSAKQLAAMFREAAAEADAERYGRAS